MVYLIFILALAIMITTHALCIASSKSEKVYDNDVEQFAKDDIDGI